MKVRLPEKRKLKKRQWTIYITIVMICIISVITVFYIEFYARIDIGKVIGVEESVFGNKTEDQKYQLETEFLNIFDNSVRNVSDQNNQKREDLNAEIVYSGYNKDQSVANEYTLDVNIPFINIDTESAYKYNIQTAETFYQKALDIIEAGDKNQNVVYTVEYTAEIYQDILSVVIISNLKEGTNAQRVIVSTYNYDLRNNKEITIEEFLRTEQLDVNLIQEQINEKIQTEQQKVEDLKSLGYEIYSRDIESKEYMIENTTEFYITNNNLYIIYPYGNDSYTSELDIVIL